MITDRKRRPEKMRTLVTGGAGFIGSHLVEHFVNAGAEVIILDNFSTGRLENVAHLLDRIELIEGDVSDMAACRQATMGVDYVFHEAALPSVPRSIRDPGATHQACATGTLNVLLAARDAGVSRLVYASSSSAYGDTPDLPKVETMAPTPRSPYAVAKLAGEYYCRAFHSAYGMETIALRYFNVFGPRQNPTSQYGAAVPLFIAAALRDEPPVIFGDGEQTRDFTYVENVVHANHLACQAPASALGKVFNVGCGQRITLNRLWAIIRELSGTRVEALRDEARRGDVRDSLASLDLAREHLGYEPQVELEYGLRLTVDHLRSELGSIITPSSHGAKRASA